MLRKVMLATTTALALSAWGLMGAGTASAASVMSPGSPLPVLENTATNNIEQVATQRQKRIWRYNQRRHGNRYTTRRGPYTHFYGGHYYSRPWWNDGWNRGSSVSISLGGGGYGYYAPRPRVAYRAAGNSHVQWCLNNYRSYDPNSDTFMGYDGYRHRCNSPFR